MTDPKPRTLARMHRRDTCYEVIATNGHKTIRLGFTNRPNKHRLLDMARQRGDEIDAMIGENPEQATFAYSARAGWTIGPVRVKLTGRTERECASGFDHSAA